MKFKISIEHSETNKHTLNVEFFPDHGADPLKSSALFENYSQLISIIEYFINESLEGTNEWI
jgi:hypothetical protein